MDAVRLAMRIRTLLMEHPDARVIIHARVADALPLLTHLGTSGVEIASPMFDEDLPLALDRGVEVFNAAEGLAAIQGPRIVVETERGIATFLGSGST